SRGDDLLHDGVRQVDRDREPVTGVVTGRTLDRGVDPDDLTAHVDERAAGVARVDRGIRLNEVLDAAIRRPGKAHRAAPLGAHDALRHGEGEVLTERVADREHPLTDTGRITVAKRRGREAGRVDLEDGDVRGRVAADDARLELSVVEKANRDLVGAVNHVVVGQDITVGRHDEAGPRSVRLTLRRLGRLWAARHVA